jgi:dynein heavy chain 1
VLERKTRIVEEQSDALRAKIQAEDALVNQKIEEIKQQWAEDKPLLGTIPPDEAQKILVDFESRLTRLRDEAEGVSKAKESLDLQPSPENILPSVLEELQDLKSV